MKTKIAFLMIIIFCGPLSMVQGIDLAADYEPVAICLGSVKFPMSINNTNLNLFYKGKKLSIDVHNKEKEVKLVPYSLEEKKSNQQFHMIICSECEIASKDNTIQYLYVPSRIKYKFYTLGAARSYDDEGEVDGYLWTCTDERLLDDNIIPDNTVIFIFDADLIDGLNIKSWEQGSSARILPEIVIKKTVAQQVLYDALDRASLASLPLNAIHQRNVTCVKQMGKQSVLSMKS